MTNEIFKSRSRSAEDVAGVFECDGAVGYFYLYECPRGARNRIIASVRIGRKFMDSDPNNIVIKWDVTELFTGLFVRGHLATYFDIENDRGVDCRSINQSYDQTTMIDWRD
jgi:hypothetical protein